jgi:hypothetical protein
VPQTSGLLLDSPTEVLPLRRHWYELIREKVIGGVTFLVDGPYIDGTTMPFAG